MSFMKRFESRFPSSAFVCRTDARKFGFHPVLYEEIGKIYFEISAHSAVVSLDFPALVLQELQAEYRFSAHPPWVAGKSETISGFVGVYFLPHLVTCLFRRGQ